MRNRTLPVPGAAALAALALGAAVTAAPARAQTGALPGFEAALVRETNAVRAEHGLPPLRRVAVLARPARAHSRYMALTGDFAHEGPGGAPFWRRLVAAGYPRYRRMAENIAEVPGCDAEAARSLVRLWMDSPPHRANLLDPRLRVTGGGAWTAGDCDAVMVTADYGS